MMNSIGNVISFMQQMQPEKMVPQREQRKGGLFNSLDTDSSGGISQSEFEVLAQGISKLTGKEIDAGQVFKTYNVDGNKELSGEELFQAMSANGVRPPPPPMTKGGLFNSLDTDSSGGISQSELEVLAQGISKFTGKEISAEEVLSTYDVDKNKELSGEELFQAMSGSGVTPPPPPSFYEVKRGMAVYEMNSQDSTYQKLVRYVGSESQNLETGSVKVSA